MTESTIHIVGAGLAGLAAAVHLSCAGKRVRLYEAAPTAGGRARSYEDRELGARIDNGNHLLLSCNEAALSYLSIIGAKDTLHTPDKAEFPFINVQTNQRWMLSIGDGFFPSWIFSKKRRVPGTHALDYLQGLKLLTAGRWETVADKLDTKRALYRTFWQPLTVAIMNTKAEEASARIMGRVLEEAFASGGKGLRPLTVKDGLSESFVQPALDYIKARGGDIQFGKRLQSMETGADEIKKLVFAGGEVVLQRWDWAVLALPPWSIAEVLPQIPAPVEFRGIVNAHFRLDVPKSRTRITGIIGGTAEWVFEKNGIVSTTTSAAEAIIDKPAEELAGLLWKDVAKLYGLETAAMPAARVVKEKRATFAAAPEQSFRRAKIEARNGNLVVCGDWTDTGLPSTIEGAIRSGRQAAACIVSIPKKL